MKLASLNVGSMTGRSGEIVQLMRTKSLQVLCVQETKWKGSKAREIGAGYKLYYHGEDGTKNGVGIVLSEDMKDRVLAVERTCDRVMRMKLEIEGEVWHIISCYAPQVGCTQQEKDEFWEHMDAEMQAVPGSERLVVAGDLNGHVGRDRDGYDGVHGGHGLGVRNEEGIKIMDFATAYEMRLMNTYYKKRENHLVTYNSGGRRSQIDFIMLRKEYTKECKNCKVLPKEAITTQHRVLIAELEVKATRKRRVEGRKMIRWWKLKNDEVREEFRRSVVERMANAHEVTTENVEEWWEETAGLIRSCGEEVCGRSSGKKKPGLESWWWNEETEKAVREKEDRLKMWKQTGDDDDRNEYKRAKGAAKKVVARVKADAIEELYANLETSEGQKDIYRIAAARDRAGKDIGQMRTIKSATGDVLMRDEDIRERWGQYFSWLMNEENPRVETEEREPNQGLTAPINEAETERSLKGMKSGKAVGSDEIPAEVWKCLGWFGVVTLCKLFNSIMITETIPSAWRDSVLVPIFKEKGDIQECKNYRGIKLLTHTFKIWERVLDRRVRECTDIHESQFGFMPGRSTTDATFILKQTIEQYREGQKDICVTFIDLEKAYDRVPREEIWRTMRERLVPEKYVKLVQDMYTGCRTKVRTVAGESSKFNVEVGLHQGSALSPYLFLILMDVLTERVRKEAPESMLFADDIVLCGDKDVDMTEYLESWRKALEERGMRVSRPKTQFIDFSFEQNAQGNRTQVKILGEEVERVTHFKYLGTSIEEEGGMETEIAKRVGAGWMNWKKCSGVLCDKKMPVKLKGKVYRTVVRPAMLYGAETWATTKRQESRIEVNEMRMLRWMCGVTRKDKIRNEHIRGTTKVAQASRKITERRLKWYGHVMRMEEDHVVKRVMTKAIPGKRKRGRPKTRWKDVCKRDMQTVGLREGDAGDRAYWKEMINNHSGDPR